LRHAEISVELKGRFGFTEEEVRYIPGGDVLLGLQGAIRIRGAEDAEYLDRLREERKKREQWEWQSDDLRERTTNGRERRFLEMVFPVGGRAIVVYGAGHCFADNLAEFNRRNAREKGCLIEISPSGLRDD
jgi:hypothetical protein